MIQNNSLGDRLNEFKNDQQIPETNYTVGNIKPVTSLFNSLVSLVVISVKSLIYGYGLKTLVDADWNFFGYFCIGMSITFILEYTLDLIALFTS